MIFICCFKHKFKLLDMFGVSGLPSSLLPHVSSNYEYCVERIVVLLFLNLKGNFYFLFTLEKVHLGRGGGHIFLGVVKTKRNSKFMKKYHKEKRDTLVKHILRCSKLVHILKEKILEAEKHWNK